MGVAMGPGLGEELVSTEVKDGAVLLAAFLAVGVPFDLSDRVMVRGGFPYPLTLSALQLVGCVLLGVGLTRRTSKPDWLATMRWRDYARDYAPLGILQAVYVASVHEAIRSQKGGPRVASAFVASQGVLVILVELARRQLSMDFGSAWFGASASAPSDAEAGANEARLEHAITPAEAEEEKEDRSAVRQRRRALRREEEEVDEDECEECCCCGASWCAWEYPPGGFAATLALLIAFGGAGIIALGEAEVGPISAPTYALLAAAQLCIAMYYVALERRFVTTAKLAAMERNQARSLASGAETEVSGLVQDIAATSASETRRELTPGSALYLVAPVSALAVSAVALALELTPRWRVGTDGKSPTFHNINSPHYAGHWGVWLLVLDVACFAATAGVALAVLKRFSALVVVLFVLVKSIVSLFVAAGVFGDVITSLEYKGAMVATLGLALWSLEVSKAILEPTSLLGKAAREKALEADVDSFESSTGTTIAPSAFLEGDAAEEAYAQRQRERNQIRRAAADPPAPSRPRQTPFDDDDDDDDQPPPSLDDMARARLSRSGFFDGGVSLFNSEPQRTACTVDDDDDLCSPAQ